MADKTNTDRTAEVYTILQKFDYIDGVSQNAVDSAVVDLLTNIMHFVDEYGDQTFEVALRIAKEHHEEEVG